MPLLSSSVARRTLGFMLAGTTVLFAIVMMSAWLASRTENNAEDVTRARELRTLSSVVLEQLLDAEASQRGFLLTEDQSCLIPYEEAKRSLNAALERLRTLVKSDPDSSRSVERISVLANAKMVSESVP